MGYYCRHHISAFIEELFLQGMKMQLWPEGPGRGTGNFLDIDDKPFGML